MIMRSIMGKVFLICGKICSGKSYYAKSLKEKYNAWVLATSINPGFYEMMINM